MGKEEKTGVDIAERVRFLMRELNLRQQEFAKRIGIDASNLSKYINRRLPVSDALVNRIVVSLGVSKQWLETGEGSPFVDGSATELTLPLSGPVTPPGEVTLPSLTVSTDRMALHNGILTRGTPVYDIDVTAGAMPRERMFADDNIIGYISLPQFDPLDRVVTVSGDSMSPVIRDGDMVVLREMPGTDIIYWGQIYAVLTDTFRFLKYVRRHPDPEMVILRSENPNYDDIDLPRRKILDLMVVRNIIHQDRRM